jgi:N-glycosylase/DNA lyase
MQLKLDFQENDNSLFIDEISTLSPSVFRLIDEIPDPNQELMNGIKWGHSSQLFTPAYWKAQYLMNNQNDTFSINYKLGNDIKEEVVACLLGGFGLKAELGIAAFERLKNQNLIKKNVSYSEIFACLKEPFMINSRKIHYRFPNQKAKFISEFLNRNDIESIEKYDDISMRDWLMTINGIGPKTASWITRNYLQSENVAIIDIHIYRACKIMKLFPEDFDIQRNYSNLERLFLMFCSNIGVQPSKMDALIWLQMKYSNTLAIKSIDKQ